MPWLVHAVRPVPEYAAGHLPGAISLPIDELQERFDEVTSGAQVVAYCGGSYCVYADDTVRLLTNEGRGRTGSRTGTRTGQRPASRSSMSAIGAPPNSTRGQRSQQDTGPE